MIVGLTPNANASRRPAAAQTPTVNWVAANCKTAIASVFRAQLHVTATTVKLEHNACILYVGFNPANLSAEAEAIINPIPAAENKLYFDEDYNSLVAAKNRPPTPGYTPYTITLTNVSNVGTKAYEETTTAGAGAAAVNSYEGFVGISVEANGGYALSFSAMKAFSRALYKEIASAVK